MAEKRKIEVFSARCNVCETAIEQIKAAACPSCDIIVLDMNDPNVAARAEDLSIRSIPTVLVDGKIADCCSGRGVNIDVLRAAGVGQPLS